MVLLAKSVMELLMFFWYLTFLDKRALDENADNVIVNKEIVLFGSNQSMFHCELTPSYKSCTPKFRI